MFWSVIIQFSFRNMYVILWFMKSALVDCGDNSVIWNIEPSLPSLYANLCEIMCCLLDRKGSVALWSTENLKYQTLYGRLPF